ncbi:cytochrome P450 [Aspergillus coremiiformis]|uniref:Cytochrome P450 n=1 Tax=Aspergillus coremiiformis TaxID=138285 RepID=A0A5N6ZG29_9EURO|nr:cytochrome P450 [Aspergillus coremiiformis]
MKFSTEETNQLNLPTVRYGRFLPSVVNRVLDIGTTPSQIYYGYEKYKSKPFRVPHMDGDLVVLPLKYLEELKDLHPSQTSVVDAHYKNTLEQYINIPTNSDLPAYAVSITLNRTFNRLIPRLILELHHAFSVVLPKCKNDHVSINLYETILRLLAHSLSRVIIGKKLWKNDLWINVIIHYTYDVCMTVIKLRSIPKFFRRLVFPFLSSVRNLEDRFQWIAEQLLIPMIRARRQAEFTDPSYRKPDDFLQWMMDLADNDFDRDPTNLARGLMTTLALGVVQTSAMLITHAIYDLMVHPEYLLSLRGEINDILTDGWFRASQSELDALHYLDSFLRESHRLNPTSVVSPLRSLKQPLTLSDGIVLPKGTRICFPSGPMSCDPKIVPCPLIFDGFRWCKEPCSQGRSLTTIEVTNLHFGFGRQACPGRFFGSYIAKAVLSHFLMEYDIKFQDGHVGRPKNVVNGEHFMPNMDTVVLIKQARVKGTKVDDIERF